MLGGQRVRLRTAHALPLCGQAFLAKLGGGERTALREAQLALALRT